MKIESIYYNATLNQFAIVTMSDEGLTVEKGIRRAIAQDLDYAKKVLAQEDVILVGYL